MENLNTRIYNIFKKLVESRGEYIETINFHTGFIIYKINDIEIKLYKIKTDKSANNYSDNDALYRFWDDIYSDNGELKFILSVHGKRYIVPEITSRTEYAQIMDTLDETIQDWENNVLTDIENSIKDIDNLE